MFLCIVFIDWLCLAVIHLDIPLLSLKKPFNFTALFLYSLITSENLLFSGGIKKTGDIKWVKYLNLFMLFLLFKSSSTCTSSSVFLASVHSLFACWFVCLFVCFFLILCPFFLGFSPIWPMLTSVYLVVIVTCTNFYPFCFWRMVLLVIMSYKIWEIWTFFWILSLNLSDNQNMSKTFRVGLCKSCFWFLRVTREVLRAFQRTIWKSQHQHLGISISTDIVSIGIVKILFFPSKFFKK